VAITPVAAQSYTPESLADELQRIQREVDAGRDAALNNLPPNWDVQTPEHAYGISTRPLRDLAKGDGRLSAASNWLQELQRQLQSYSSQGGRIAPEPRQELLKILARREFAAAAPPNAWERLRQSIYAWIGRMLEKIFQYAAQHPTGSQVVFWVVLVCSVVGLGLWLLRLFQTETVPIRPPVTAGIQAEVRRWQEWLAAAQKASAQGDHREAIRCAYWAAVMRLQQKGSLPVELTNTPRERLRFMNLPAYREPLTGLTTALERFWYAKQPVGPEDVRESFRNMEAVECKAD